MKSGVSATMPSTRPTWRAVSVQPPCTACGERPRSAASVSASIVMPRPKPIAIWLGTVHHHSGCGSSASEASPAASSTVPAAARAGSEPTLPSSFAATIAETGITVTTSAVAIGSICQPSISSRTIRNSAAVSPALSSTSARFAAMCGRPAGSCVAWVRTRRVGSASRIAGTWMKKIASHEISCVRRPPSAGPKAAPSAPAVAQTTAARRSEPVVTGRISSAAVTAIAPPIACTPRLRSSTSNDGASAQNSDAAAKTARPTSSSTPGARRRTRCATGTATTASTMLNPVSTHATCPIESEKRARMSGSASTTIDESLSTSPTASARQIVCSRLPEPSTGATSRGSADAATSCAPRGTGCGSPRRAGLVSPRRSGRLSGSSMPRV